MAGYTKLFSTILASTIWREPAEVRVVWITMLAMSDAHGRVDGSIPGLADLARVSLDQCQSALKCLSEPDFYSRTKDHEGRRIREIDGGWEILNYLKYREATSDDLRRAKNREAVKRFREKRNITVIKGNIGNAPSPQAEAVGIEQRHTKTLGAVAPATTDSEWLTSLEGNEAYTGMPVAVEYAKMRAWCEVNKKAPTRRRFINWLNRAERPMGALLKPKASQAETDAEQARLAKDFKYHGN